MVYDGSFLSIEDLRRKIAHACGVPSSKCIAAPRPIALEYGTTASTVYLYIGTSSIDANVIKSVDMSHVHEIQWLNTSKDGVSDESVTFRGLNDKTVDVAPPPVAPPPPAVPLTTSKIRNPTLTPETGNETENGPEHPTRPLVASSPIATTVSPVDGMFPLYNQHCEEMSPGGLWRLSLGRYSGGARTCGTRSTNLRLPNITHEFGL